MAPGQAGAEAERERPDQDGPQRAIHPAQGTRPARPAGGAAARQLQSAPWNAPPARARSARPRRERRRGGAASPRDRGGARDPAGRRHRGGRGDRHERGPGRRLRRGLRDRRRRVLAHLGRGRRRRRWRSTAPGGRRRRRTRRPCGRAAWRRSPTAARWRSRCRAPSRSWGDAHARYGRLPWADLLAPAIELAGGGFPADDGFIRAVEGSASIFARELGDGARGWAATYRPHGRPWRPGERVRLPALAATLERIAVAGATSSTAARLAARQAAGLAAAGSAITATDLAAHASTWETPISTGLPGRARPRPTRPTARASSRSRSSTSSSR